MPPAITEAQARFSERYDDAPTLHFTELAHGDSRSILRLGFFLQFHPIQDLDLVPLHSNHAFRSKARQVPRNHLANRAES